MLRDPEPLSTLDKLMLGVAISALTLLITGAINLL